MAKPPGLTITRSAPAQRVMEQLESNRAATMEAATQLGHRALLRMLRKAQAKLDQRLPTINPAAEFTLAAQRQTLAQLKLIVGGVRRGKKVLVPGLIDDVESVIRGTAHTVAVSSSASMVNYMVDAEKAFTGISTLGPRLREAVQLDVAVAGADASVLRRVATDPSYRGEAAQAGVMERYGIATILQFEQTMQQGLLTNQPWGETRAALVADSQWLQGNPLSWAERILRTETMAASNRATHEVMRQTEVEVGETLRVLIASFDDRTGWDSYQVHGMIRRMDEPFEDGMGNVYMTPPNRPNDREVVVPHLIEWPITEGMMPRSDDEVQEAWVRQTRSKKHPEGRPGGPPPRPLMSTVPELLSPT